MRSIGATAVFDTAAETPPAMKFLSESYGSESPDIFPTFCFFESPYSTFVLHCIKFYYTKQNKRNDIGINFNKTDQ